MRKIKKSKTNIVARWQSIGKPFDVKAIEIEVMIVDKVISNAFMDGWSGLNIMSMQTIEKLGQCLTRFSSFVINLVKQSLVKSIG